MIIKQSAYFFSNISQQHTQLFAGFTLAAQYIYAHHTYMLTTYMCAQADTHGHTHTPLHMLVTFATYIFLFALHIHVELVLKKQNKM